jgi:ATP phosphoribosyltransferase
MSTIATTRERLRIAVQKSGRLADASMDLLSRCGLKFRHSRDKLFCFGESLAIDLLLVRDDDIPGLIAQGVCELGIVGRNVVEEFRLAHAGSRPDVQELRALDFGACRLAVAVPQAMEYANAASLRGLRIATSYPAMLDEWLRKNEVSARIVELSGSVEIAPRLGTADAICDLVSSGATLAANQLREAATVMESRAVLAGACRAPVGVVAELCELLLRRVESAIAVRESKLVMLRAPRSAIAEIVRILPASQSPTLASVEDDTEVVSVQAVCESAVTWQHLEAMKRAGACRLLVLPVEKMLA